MFIRGENAKRNSTVKVFFFYFSVCGTQDSQGSMLDFVGLNVFEVKLTIASRWAGQIVKY